MEKPRNTCLRCGTCCRKGGPTLHREDLAILLEGHVGHRHLVTVRKGEPVFDPVRGTLVPARQELVKVRGQGSAWTCFFFDEKNAACKIYEHRFLECRLLKCWDPSELISVMGKNTIVRADIINADDPILKVIETHERVCSYHDVEKLILNLSRRADKAKTLAQLTELISKDLAIRSYAISELGLREEVELFIFGRPLFKILSAWDIDSSAGRVIGSASQPPPALQEEPE